MVYSFTPLTATGVAMAVISAHRPDDVAGVIDAMAKLNAHAYNVCGEGDPLKVRRNGERWYIEGEMSAEGDPRDLREVLYEACDIIDDYADGAKGL